MGKFTKAQPKQAKFKLAIYGKQGSGKTFTALLFAEGLAALEGKRIAYIDTESGTDFYAQDINEREVHPHAFDFDRLITRSITEALEAVQDIDTDVYGVVVIDSITHLWEATMNAYTGKRMSNGGIPIQGWGPLKKPYKALMTAFLNGNFHAIICGREGIVMEEDDEGEAKAVGTKIKAEGETGYEPHILIRMKPEWQPDKTTRIAAFFEKDRTGIYSNKTVYEPDFSTIHPVLKYLGASSQQRFESPDETAARDADKLAEAAEQAESEKRTLFETIRDAINTAKDVEALKVAWGLTKGKKGKLGDELFEKLEALKDARKGELIHAV